jgi:hypothetical protein
MKKTMAMTTLWIATAVVAAGGATTALATSSGSSGAKVLSQSDVRTKLATESAPPRFTLPAVEAAKSGKEWAIEVQDAGTVFVRCKGNTLTTYRTVANPGYTGEASRTTIKEPTGKTHQGIEFYFSREVPDGLEIKGGHTWCENGKPAPGSGASKSK